MFSASEVRDERCRLEFGRPMSRALLFDACSSWASGERARTLSSLLSRVHPLLLLLVGSPSKGTQYILIRRIRRIRRPAGNLGSPLHAAARM